MGMLRRSTMVQLSVLDLAYVGEGFTPADALKNALDLAQHAEAAGYARFWLAEHHNLAGIASAAFVAFLSRLTNTSFTAMQYAIFSSLMSLFPKIIGGYSGSIVENIGYIDFFLYASLLGIPVLGVIYLANKHSKIE